MPEHFGKKVSKVLPESYNQKTLLQTSFNGSVIATGHWTSEGFVLKANSLIKNHSTLKSNSGTLRTLDEVKRRLYAIDKEGDYLILKVDIRLSSPSTAARLVHGNDRNGKFDWSSSLGESLSQLLNS